VLVRIKYVSVMVEDQEQALRFYTDVLGFTKVADVPVGEYRWLTVRSPEGPEGVELLLEPTAFPPARVYQKALFEAGIPATAFVTTDIHGEVARLRSAGVFFRGEPTDMGTVTAVAFEDTCGNLIQLVQPAAQPAP
jgi:catechol 2,3-dioxygenase-like lactoylglutathione lyase family enzyme